MHYRFFIVTMPDFQINSLVNCPAIQFSKGGHSVFFFRASVTFVFFATLIASPAFATRAHHASASGHAHISHRAARRHQLHGQTAIEPARVTQIQQALIREHYMTGEANGNWDAATEAAMQKYQADQGWQTKLMPDSRAIKKLGLGPDYSNAINAKDSSFGEPPPASTIPPVQSAGFADAAGVNH
jgi:hypothetical protein